MKIAPVFIWNYHGGRIVVAFLDYGAVRLGALSGVKRIVSWVGSRLVPSFTAFSWASLIICAHSL